MIDMVVGLLTSAESLPAVAKVVVYIVLASQVASALVTAVVAIAHGALGVLKAVGIVSAPVARVEAGLEAKEASAEGFLNDRILPILNRLSLIPLPKA